MCIAIFLWSEVRHHFTFINIQYYITYYVLLILFTMLAGCFGLAAYRLDAEHFWFHILVELFIAMLMVLLTIVIVEKMLEYRQEKERKERWAVIRNDSLDYLEMVLYIIVVRTAAQLLDDPLQLASNDTKHTKHLAYENVWQDLKRQHEALKQSDDAQTVQALAGKITQLQEILTPAFNMLRTVSVPAILHSSRNRTLHRGILVLSSAMCSFEIAMVVPSSNIFSCT